MKRFIIEEGILKAHHGQDKIVIVPSGVRQIGGEVLEADRSRDEVKCGDPLAYSAFWNDNFVEELYLPDSVEKIGFKSIHHCDNLKVLSFSNNVKGVFRLVGCDKLERIIFRGTVEEFEKLCPDLSGTVKRIDCTDGCFQQIED